MKRRDFFKILGLGAAGITLTACASDTPQEVKYKPKLKPKAKRKYSPYNRISFNDMSNTFIELRKTYPERYIRSGNVELTPKITTYRSVRNENILIRMDVSDSEIISVYDMIDMDRC